MSSLDAEQEIGDVSVTNHLNHLPESLESPKPRLDSSSSPHLSSLGSKNADIPVMQGAPRAQLTRSKTLPMSPSHVSPRTFIDLEEAKLHRFKQWMVCIAIGEQCSVRSIIDLTNLQVQFDVDYGPKVELVIPAVDIPQSERTNMSVCA